MYNFSVTFYFTDKKFRRTVGIIVITFTITIFARCPLLDDIVEIVCFFVYFFDFFDFFQQNFFSKFAQYRSGRCLDFGRAASSAEVHSSAGHDGCDN